MKRSTFLYRILTPLLHLLLLLLFHIVLLLHHVLLTGEKPLGHLSTTAQPTEQRREPKRPPLDPHGVDEKVHEQPVRAAEDEEDAEILKGQSAICRSIR